MGGSIVVVDDNRGRRGQVDRDLISCSSEERHESVMIEMYPIVMGVRQVPSKESKSAKQKCLSTAPTKNTRRW